MTVSNYFTCPFGTLLITCDEQALIGISFLGDKKDLFLKNRDENTIMKHVFDELEQYFQGKRDTFDVPLKTVGTSFQTKVWNELLNIPYGKTITYGEVARRIGNPKASRAVGGAIHNNPIPIIIPCHRVIGSNGTLTGFGWGLDIKRTLLDLEGAQYT